MSETTETNAADQPPGVDARAVISARATLAPGVCVGAYAIVGDDVEFGEGCLLHPHAVCKARRDLGRGNVLHPFCSFGATRKI